MIYQIGCGHYLSLIFRVDVGLGDASLRITDASLMLLSGFYLSMETGKIRIADFVGGGIKEYGQNYSICLSKTQILNGS